MQKLKDVRSWLRGLVHAGISGGTVAISTTLVAHDTFNFSDGLQNLLSVAGISAIVSIAKYLSTNPLPGGSENADEK